MTDQLNLKHNISEEKHSPLSLSSFVCATTAQVSSELEGESVILHLETGIYYGLNEVGSYVWNLIQTPKKVSEVLDSLLNEYEVEPDDCARELMILLHELENSKLIEVSNGKNG